MKKVYRYVIPVDDRVHSVLLTSNPLHVAGGLDYIEFWAEYDGDYRSRERCFRVFGTGHEIPDHYEYRGTAPRNTLGLVWHLYERSIQ